MLKKLNKVNNFLRALVLAVCAVCAVFKLADKKISQPKQKNDGFQTKEFDDIW